MHEQSIRCFKAYVYQITLQWAFYDFQDIMQYTFSSKLWGQVAHPYPRCQCSYQTDTIGYTMQETEVDPVLLTTLSGTQKVIYKGENYCF